MRANDLIWRAFFALLLTVVLTTACEKSTGFPQGRWVDLSHDFSAETVYWPTAQPFKLNTVAAGMTDKGYYYAAYQFCAAEHGGTHVDAPIHFAKGGRTVDQIPLTQLIGPAIKIDVSDKVTNDRDYRISTEDLTAWESDHRKIPDGVIVLFETGFGRYWSDRMEYLGTAERGQKGVDELHFPGLHPRAARWLAENRQVRAVGIDTASIDYGQSKNFGAHVALMTREVPAFENIANLNKVPATGAHVVALPMKIEGGSGGPLRIVAWIPK